MINEKEIASGISYLSSQFQLEGQNINSNGGNSHKNIPYSKFISTQKVSFHGICRINDQKGIL